MLKQGKNKYPVTEVVLHTAAIRYPKTFLKNFNTVTKMRDEIKLWHTRDNNWRDIGYHYVVAPDGSVAKGRPDNQIGAHVKNHNRGTIGICMINPRPHDGIAKFENYFTPAQRKSVKKIISKLGVQKVTGHNEYAAKECPGFIVHSEDWLSEPERKWYQKIWGWFS